MKPGNRRLEWNTIGLVLALAVAGLGAAVGFDRDRSFSNHTHRHASYYVLFGLIGGSGRTLVVEILVANGFLLLGRARLQTNLWLIAAAMVMECSTSYITPLSIILDCRVGSPASVWPLMCSLADGWPHY